jgi:hypothetical protein
LTYAVVGVGPLYLCVHLHPAQRSELDGAARTPDSAVDVDAGIVRVAIPESVGVISESQRAPGVEDVEHAHSSLIVSVRMLGCRNKNGGWLTRR